MSICACAWTCVLLLQVVPHITDALQEWILGVSERCVDGTGRRPNVCIIELGGTLGDIESMPFVEALRQLQVASSSELRQVICRFTRLIRVIRVKH